MNGGRFDFDDGGTYCGGWEDGKAHGHGVCTGPKGQGEYAGAWHYGFEVSGVYTWPSGNTFEGQWQNGKRHGVGVERRGHWLYRGEWTQGYKGRYGVRYSTNSQAKYQGTWSSGLQDGYGTETYADGGTYMGQWMRGMRHGYGSRKSAAYSVAAKYRSRSHAHASLTSLRSEQGDDIVPADGSKPGSKDDGCGGEENRGGFVLCARSEAPQRRRRSLSERSLAVKRSIFQGLHITKQRSTGDIHQRVTNATGSIRSSGSTMSCTSDESGAGGGGHHHHHRHNKHDATGGGSGGGDAHTLVPPQEDVVAPATSENYSGEWKNDKRSGFGVADRTDGLKYEGEWFNNKKFGYGVTTLKDGTREEGKYKNNVLVTSQRKKHLLFVRSSKLRERIEAAVAAANRAAQIAVQKADIAISRTATARDRSEQAELFAQQSQEDSGLARIHAKQFDPTFRQPGTENMKRQRTFEGNHVPYTPPIRTALSLDTDRLPSSPLSSSAAAAAMSRHLPIAADARPSHDAYYVADSPTTSPMVTPPSEMPARLLPPGSNQPSTSTASHYYSNNPSTSLVPNQTSVPPLGAQTAYYADQQQPGPSRQAPPLNLGYRQSPSHYGGGGDPYSNPRGAPLSPAASTPSHSSSRVSLTLNDHYDQYALQRAANLARAQQQASSRSAQAAARLRNVGERRCTLAGGVVPRGVLPSSSSAAAVHGDRKLLPPSDDSMSYSGELMEADQIRQAHQRHVGPDGALIEPRGSMPDVHELAVEPVVLGREEAARLSSQRRQELQRIAEEHELLRRNPLRYVFHPAVRAWIMRWKLPLLVIVVNMCLSLIFLQLLTYRHPGRPSADDDDTADDDNS